MRAPDFWNRDDVLSRLAAGALAPFGQLYGASVAWKSRHVRSFRPPVPVVCVGNITAGGSGKTPVAIAVGRALIARGRHPFFLTRGYGGEERGPVRVEGQSAEAVGDEPLLLARIAPTVVSRNRREGARFAVECGADVIVMDDGHQNFTLAKDVSIVVVDGETGFGNGRVLPAGPLREPARQGLNRAGAVIVMGDGSPALKGYAGPVLRARLEPVSGDLAGRRVLAFAGIGRPAKFFETLKSIGAEIVSIQAFPDHHHFTAFEIGRLKKQARDQNAQLVTTEKDYVRLPEAARAEVAALPVEAILSPPGGLERLLDSLPLPR